MRISYILPLLLAATLTCFATTNAEAKFIEWRAKVSDAKRESQSDGKPMLVKVSTSWCTYCVKMQHETFDDQTVIKHVEECFVPLAIDGDEHRQLIQRLGIDTFPTTLVVSPKMKVVKKIVGFRSAADLSAELIAACKKDAPPKPKMASVKTFRPRKSVFGKSDPVSLAITGLPIDGSPKFTTVYEGYKLAFQSEPNLNEFLRKSRQYWPVADGVCIVSALDTGKVAYGRLDHSLIYQNRRWLFASSAHQAQFEAAPETYIARLRDLAKSKRNRTSTDSVSSTR